MQLRQCLWTGGFFLALDFTKDTIRGTGRHTRMQRLLYVASLFAVCLTLSSLRFALGSLLSALFCLLSLVFLALDFTKDTIRGTGTDTQMLQRLPHLVLWLLFVSALSSLRFALGSLLSAISCVLSLVFLALDFTNVAFRGMDTHTHLILFWLKVSFAVCSQF
jgi:hypothetical protein